MNLQKAKLGPTHLFMYFAKERHFYGCEGSGLGSQLLAPLWAWSQSVGRLVTWPHQVCHWKRSQGLCVVIFMDGDYLPCAEVTCMCLSLARADSERRLRLDPVPRWVLFSQGHETESWKLGRNPSSLSPVPLTEQNQFRPFVESKS